MSLSRTHIAFLAIISIFTGLIGPGTHIGDRLLSYLMTDMRVLTYIILAILIIAFYTAATRQWRWFRICSVLVFIGLWILLFSTLFTKVHAIDDTAIASGLSWGWLFLTIGCLLLVIAYGQREYGNSPNGFADTIDGIIGILWGFALACIVWGIILSSLSLFSWGEKNSILRELVGSWNIRTLSWGVKTSTAYESIPYFSYDRKLNTLIMSINTGSKTLTQKWYWEGTWAINIATMSGNLIEVSEEWTLYILWTVRKSKNGTYSMSGIENNGIKKLIFNNDILGRELEEVREIFISDNGTYAYFGRPLGESKYCLFTRYKWNKCGLEWYMNPRLWADGSSVIYAGYTEGNWNIYRNSDIIVKNTGYTGRNISSDYLFFDITNPRTFLFIKKDEKTGKYIYIKNGVLLPWAWDDVGTRVDFGFDNHIITTAKDGEWWKLLEL